MLAIKNARFYPLGKALVIWMLVLIIVLLYTQGMIFGTENTLSATRSSNAGPVLDDTLLTQHLYLPEGTTALQIRLGTYERVNTALLQCTLYQEAYAQTALIPLETAEDNSYVTIPFDYDRLTEGNAVLEISGMDTGVKNFVTVYLSDETIFGQYHDGEAWDDSVNLALILSYQVMPALGFRVAYAVCLVAFLAVLLLALLREEAVWVPVRMARVNYFLIASVLFGFVMTFRISSLTVYANAGYAEGITNFFRNAYGKGFFENFTMLDEGYYPLLPRIIAVLVVKGFGIVDYYPLVVNLITISLGFFFISTLNLRSMRRAAESDLLRFTFSLFLLLTATNMQAEFWTIHNIAYPGVILISCFFLTDDETRPFVKVLLFGVISFVLIMSKGIMVSFVPVTIIYIIYAVRKNRKALLFGVLTLLGIVGQAAVMLSSMRSGTGLAVRVTESLTSQSGGFISYLFNVAMEAFTQFNVRWIRNMTDGVSLTFNHVYLICLVAIIAMNVYALKKKGKTYGSAMTIGLMLSTICGYAIVIITNNHAITYDQLFGKGVALAQYGMRLNRQTFLSYLLVSVGILIAIQAVVRKRTIAKYCVILMIMLNMINSGIMGLQNKTPYTYDEVPSWNHYTYLLSRDAYGIPIYNTYNLARDSQGVPLNKSAFSVRDAYGVPLYNTEVSTDTWYVWMYTTPSTGALYMAEEASSYINAYTLPEEAREVFRHEALSNFVFLSEAEKMYPLPITLALYDDVGELIALVPPVEDRYTKNSVYDLINLPQDRAVASIRLMQNGKYIRFNPNFALYYYEEMEAAS